jgi:hypothetical protein
MNLFSIDFSLNELAFIRQALEGVTIKGADAKFLANLQNKLEYEINQIQQMLTQSELEKQASLQELLQHEENKALKKKS